MPTLEIPYSEDLLLALGQSHQELEKDLRFWLAVKLFELGRLSVGKAAEMADMKKLHFIDELVRRGIPVVSVDEDWMEDEFRSLPEPSSSTAPR